MKKSPELKTHLLHFACYGLKMKELGIISFKSVLGEQNLRQKILCLLCKHTFLV